MYFARHYGTSEVETLYMYVYIYLTIIMKLDLHTEINLNNGETIIMKAIVSFGVIIIIVVVCVHICAVTT